MLVYMNFDSWLGDEMTRIIWKMIKDKVWIGSFFFSYCLFMVEVELL